MLNMKKSGLSCLRVTLNMKKVVGVVYQAWPHDSPVEGEEPYLFWGH
jgi:hypothetical protein